MWIIFEENEIYQNWYTSPKEETWESWKFGGTELIQSDVF